MAWSPCPYEGKPPLHLLPHKGVKIEGCWVVAKVPSNLKLKAGRRRVHYVALLIRHFPPKVAVQALKAFFTCNSFTTVKLENLLKYLFLLYDWDWDFCIFQLPNRKLAFYMCTD